MKEEKLKVLIVDDDSKFLELMKKDLEGRNCIVQCTKDPHQALSILMNDIFHVAFIDCILNSSSQGTELIQKIRNNLGHSVEIILMSGILPEKSLSSFMEMGVRDFLPKPVSARNLDYNLNQIRKKYFHGNTKNILLQLFTTGKEDVKKLKTLVSLKTVQAHEFLLYLISSLSCKASFQMDFKVNNKNYKITCSNGAIINFECNDTEYFLKKLISKNFITEKELHQLKHCSEKDCVDILLKKCILSSGQIGDAKYDIFVETISSISPNTEIPVSFHLKNIDEDALLFLTQSTCVDLIFLNLRQKFNDKIIGFFDKEVLNRSLVVEKKLTDYLPEIKGFLSHIKPGMKLRGIYETFNDHDIFYSYTLYILLKGSFYLSEISLKSKYNYLYERYNCLYKFINSSESKQLFCVLGGENIKPNLITTTDIKKYYLHFIKHNHPDKITNEAPEDLLQIITNVLSKIKTSYNFISDPEIRKKEEQKKKQKKLEEEILLTEKKKIYERYMEEKNYQKAINLLNSIPKKNLEEETDWQLLYLWLYFENEQSQKKVHLEANIIHKYLKMIQAKSRDLQKNMLYHYILGLYYENKKNYDQAKINFQRSQHIEPSFSPAYLALKRCSLQTLEKNKEKQPMFMKKFKQSLEDFKKKTGKRSKAS